MCVRISGHQEGVLVDFWSCSLLKMREDGSREATSKAQTIAATHALHALSIPKEKEGGSERCCGRWSPLEWREMAYLSIQILCNNEKLCQKEQTEKDNSDGTPLNS